MRALIPTAENKAAIWDRVVGDDGMANALQSAAIACSPIPPRVRCWRRTPRRYFAAVAQVWDRRSIEVSQKGLAVGLYPRWAVDQCTDTVTLPGSGRSPARPRAWW